MALEGVTSCIGRGMCIGAVYLNGGCCTFAVIIIGTVVGFAVDLDFVAATVICIAVFHGTAGSLKDLFEGCLILNYYCYELVFTFFVHGSGLPASFGRL